MVATTAPARNSRKGLVEEGSRIERPSFRSAGFQDQRQTIPPVPSSWTAASESNRVLPGCSRHAHHLLATVGTGGGTRTLVFGFGDRHPGRWTTPITWCSW